MAVPRSWRAANLIEMMPVHCENGNCLLPMSFWRWKRPWVWPRDPCARARHAGHQRPQRRIRHAANNPRCYYPRVDDKLHQTDLPRAANSRAEDLRHHRAAGDIAQIPQLLGGREEFVIKPAEGSEGRGIIVLAGTTARNSSPPAASGSFADCPYHLSTILSGLYSLGGQPDRAIIEQRIVQHPAFEKIAVDGTPDVRIILYRCVPVMAMVRLPTRASRGRANLHQGAVAAGIHLATGRTLGGDLQGSRGGRASRYRCSRSPAWRCPAGTTCSSPP